MPRMNFRSKGSTFSDRMRKNVRPKKRDVDLLIEFTSIAVSLLLLASLRDRLEKDLGTSVDIVHAPIPDGSILDVGKTVTLYEQ